jgi:ketosteroid isomerase-like protein
MSAILMLALAFIQPDVDVTQVTRELRRIEQQLAAAWKAGDCSSWDAWIAPDWSVTHITGAVMGKPEALQMCKTPAVPITTFEVDDVRIRLFGDTAVVTGRSRIAVGGATPGEVALRFTDVFIRRAGKWQVVASHATRVG